MPSPANLLLVDDEPRNLDVLENILQGPDHRLVRAGSAHDALLALLHEEFAAIVLDVQMPGMDGIELAHLIKQRERTQHVPIIFLTAFSQDDHRMLESYHVGAVDYLTKPVNPDVLRSKVGVFVDLHRKTEALLRSNAALEQQIAQRQAAERALRDANDELEARVEARTAALREARDAAERSGRAKDDFLAALSHELRTPLNPVLLLASEAAENPAFPPDAREQFGIIRRNIELEARLIDDLLDLTRITHGKLALDLQPRHLHRILQDALATVKPEIEQKRLHLSTDFAPGPDPIQADDVRLQQVFWNILRNAVKFTSAGGTIAVSTRLDPASGQASVVVRDTGIGLRPEEISRIYDAFAQGNHAAPKGAHRFGGLGLGLTISKSLVEQHHGQLLAESEGPGRGSTFTIHLPLAPALTPAGAAGAPAPGAASPANPDAAPGPRRRVLLVEDHEPTRTTLVTLLRRRNYEVTPAATLADARQLAGGQVFDFLISDIGLPDGSGFELMQELRHRGHVRGLALTGYGMDHDVARSRAAGFTVHLTKPILVQSLDKALAELSR